MSSITVTVQNRAEAFVELILDRQILSCLKPRLASDLRGFRTALPA